jgi:hypothetical protein
MTGDELDRDLRCDRSNLPDELLSFHLIRHRAISEHEADALARPDAASAWWLITPRIALRIGLEARSFNHEARRSSGVGQQLTMPGTLQVSTYRGEADVD